MEIFLTSISGILVILGMILVGFVMGEKGWFDDKSRGLIAKLVTQIALALLHALYDHTAFHSDRPTQDVARIAFSCTFYGDFAWDCDSGG